MKVKLNKRLMRIGLGCMITALILTSFMYRNIKRAASPEDTIRVAHFSSNLERNTILQDRDIQMLEVPISRVPERGLTSKELLVGKRLIADVNKGEYAFLNKVTERGDIRLDIEDMWIIGIDVKDISNFIGVQLKAGEYYGLLYHDDAGEMNVRHMVKIVSMIDSLGREIFSNADGIPKTINVAVKRKEEILSISNAKHKSAAFEIVRTPIDWKMNVEEKNMVIQHEYDENESIP